MVAILEVSDEAQGVRVLTLCNPRRKNALDAGLLEALSRALTTSDPVRAWILRGAGADAFCAGYDLTALQQHQDGQRLPDERLGEVLDQLGRHPAPSVALVTGPAIGAGCELAMACDFRVGSSAARFAMPPARLGVVYALKGLQRVQARVGEAFARWMFLTGRPVDGATAHARGLLDVLADDAPEQALRLCAELASNAPLAMAGIKQGLRLLEDAGGTPQERAAYEALRRASFASEDAQEGVRAALEKRRPVFTGR